MSAWDLVLPAFTRSKHSSGVHSGREGKNGQAFCCGSNDHSTSNPTLQKFQIGSKKKKTFQIGTLHQTWALEWCIIYKKAIIIHLINWPRKTILVLNNMYIRIKLNCKHQDIKLNFTHIHTYTINYLFNYFLK